jgi:hypothetical protein
MPRAFGMTIDSSGLLRSPSAPAVSGARPFLFPNVRVASIPRQLERAGQYFGPTNSSSRATASFLATEMVFGFEKRHATPSQSRV